MEQAKEEVRSKADLVSIVGRRVALKRKGTYYVGRCPFHDDHDPSMHVNTQLGIYKCFVCGAGGDVFKFVMEIEHMGFREALELLARETGVTLPERTTEDPQVAIRHGAARSALDFAQDWFHHNLLESPEVLSYAHRRGLTDGEITDFHLGLAPEGGLLDAARRAGHSLESLEGAGLAVRGENGQWRERFRLRLIFPLQDMSRRVVGFAGRNLRKGRKDIPKYLNSPETDFYRKSQFLFGLGHARADIAKTGEVVVVEGYMDWMALWRNGIRNVVAVSGTAFTREQARLLARHGKRVVCFFDGDRAGLAAAERSLPVLLSEGLEARIADLAQKAKDPDELVKAEGPEGLRDCIAAARHWVHFLMAGFRATTPHPSPGDKSEFLRRVRALLAAIPEDDLRDQCIREAHPHLEILGVGDHDLRKPSTKPEPIRSIPARNGNPTPSTFPVHPAGKKEILSGIRRVEAQFLHVILSHPTLALDIRDTVHPSDLVEDRCRELWDLILASCELTDAPLEPRSFVANLESSLAGFVAELFQLFEVRQDELEARSWLDDFQRDLEARRMRKRRRILTAQAKISTGTDRPLSEFSELLAREQHLLSPRMEP
ncbi:MAG TPA: DNA primase [Fibrobacteria bacterium]|nr:DNA primase [Fibrobacteria bacterium]